MSYIPNLKNLKWIDLSENHQKIRKKVEEYISISCRDRSADANPLMVKGAFGVGKTNMLSYAFTYAWTELGVPAFFIDLNSIIDAIDERKKDLGVTLIDGNTLIDILEEQVELLKIQLNEGDWEKINGFSNNHTDTESVNNFLEDVKPLQLAELNGTTLSERKLSELSGEKIRHAVKSGSKALLIIDEFEDKYWKLKQRLEYSGGGPLRVLFEYVIKPDSQFYLIIGNGPASGYEVGAENADASGSETAQNRRLEVLNVPFPRPTMLSRSFLANESIGYINFIWWLSRSRPGLIQKAIDELVSQQDILENDYATVIKEKSLFFQPVDSQSDTVKYLNDKFFEEKIPPHIINSVFKNLLFNNCPNKVTIGELNSHFSKCKTAFIGSKKLKYRSEILSIIESDLNSTDETRKVSLKHFQSQSKYKKAEWRVIGYYLNTILESISDQEGNIAFGVLGNDNWQDLFATTILKPLIQLTYDFIIQFEDSNEQSTQHCCDFLLEVIKLIDSSLQEDKLDELFSGIIYRDKDEDIKNFTSINIATYKDELNLQLSPLAIREAFEQPIGDPRLNYKNDRIDLAIDRISKVDVIVRYFDPIQNAEIIFIPDLPDVLLETYVDNLKTYLNDNYYGKYWHDGKLTLSIVYLKERDEIKELQEHLAKNSDGLEETIWGLGKITVKSIDEFDLQFPRLMFDFIDSLCKIGIIARSAGELEDCYDQDNKLFISIEKIKNAILQPQWSEKKEVRRTIEHFSKLLFEGEKAAIATIISTTIHNYEKSLEKVVPNKKDFYSNLFNIGISKELLDNGRDIGSATRRILYLLLVEKPQPPEELITVLKSCDNFKFWAPLEEKMKYFDPREISAFYKKSTNFLDRHKDFHFTPFISNLGELYQKLVKEDEDVETIEDCYSFLNDDKFFIGSYHERLGGYDSTKIFSETLYSLKHFDSVDVEAEKIKLFEKLSKLRDSLSKSNTELSETIEIFKEIFPSKISLDYPDEAGKVISKLLTPLFNLIEKHPCYSILLAGYQLIYFLERVVKSVNKFNSDLLSIINDVEDSKEKLQIIQDKIDLLYNDPFNKSVFKIRGETQTDFASNFITLSIMQKNAYKDIFNEDKRYSPFGNYEIGDVEVKTLLTAISESFASHKTKAEEKLIILNLIAEEIAELNDMEEKIEELLNITVNV